MHLLHTEAATAKRLCLQGKRAVGDSKMKNREKGHTAVVGLGGSCSLLVQESLLSCVARSICVKGSTGKKQRCPFGVLEVLEIQIICCVE